MALSFKPVMTDDGGTRRKKEEEVTTKAPSNVGAGLAAAEQARQQTQTQTPYEKRQAEIKAGVNKAKPISYALPEKTKQEEPEEEQQVKPAAGNMTAPAHKQYKAADVDEEVENLKKEKPEQYGEIQNPAAQAAVPQTTAEATAEEKESKPRRSGEYRAEANTDKITYTGGEIAKKNTRTGTAAQTKAALTEEDEEEELSWTKAPSDLTAGLQAAEEERRQRLAAQQQKKQQILQDRYMEENGFSWTGNPSMSADRTTTGSGETFMDPDIQAAYEHSVQAWLDYGLPEEEAKANAKRALADQMKTTVSELPKTVQRYGEIRAEAQAPAAPTTQAAAASRPTTEPTIEELAKQYGISQGTLEDPDFQKILQNMKAQGMTNSAALSNSYAQFQGTRQDEKRQLVYDLEEKYLDEAGLDYSDLGNAEADALHARAVKEAEEAFKEPTYRYTGEQRAEKQAPKFTWPTFGGKAANTTTTPTTGGTNNRPGAAAEVASWDQNQGWVQQNEKEGGVIDESSKPRTDKNGNVTTNAAGNPVTTGSTQSTTQNSTDKSSNPKGTQYLTPSYGQGGKVVKLPYKSGGYTEAELMALGNKAYGTKYGANVYEGYYQAPDGNYYPVDQEKAAYYLKNGYSYDGWEEPMRDYYKTFGTFYGYRPDWKQSGNSNNNYSFSPRNYSYSSGGNYGSGRSYGRGSTPSNGLYWNGNTSWSI